MEARGGDCQRCDGRPRHRLAGAQGRCRLYLAQPIDKPAAAKYNRIMMGLGVRVANAKARPRWNDSSFFKRFATH